MVNAAGIANGTFLTGVGGVGGVDLKGTMTVTYSRPKWSVGARVKYFNSYWLQSDHGVVKLLGEARAPAQAYIDLFGSWNIRPKTQLRLGVNNVLHAQPPLSLQNPSFYSFYGDPRLTNFYLSVKQSF